MIFGIGLDLVEIYRIEKILNRYHLKFPQRILCGIEMDRFMLLQSPSRSRFLAKRFAAKEAFAKAIGTGIGKFLKFRDVGVKNDELGAPHYFFVNKKFFEHLKHRDKNIVAHLSITDERTHAAAVCILSRF